MGMEFNGLFDSLLPNIYINGITLENKLPPPSSNKDNISPYIEEEGDYEDPSAKQYKKYETFEINEDFPGDEKPLMQIINYASYFSINLNLSVNFPNVGEENFNKFILNNFIKNIRVVAGAFCGEKGKTLYKDLIDKRDILDEMSSYLMGGKPKYGDLLSLVNKYKITNPSVIWETPLSQHVSLKTVPLTIDKEVLDNVDKLKNQLPDGTIVYKLPVKIQLPLLADSKPSDLSLLAYCCDISGQSTKLYGRIAKEIVIKNNKLEDKAMLFYVSSNQETEEHEKAFGNKKCEDIDISYEKVVFLNSKNNTTFFHN